MGWGSAIKKTAAPVVQAARAAAYELTKIDWDRLVTIDLETYYDSDYTLKKMSTSEYVRDPRFKAQMVGIKIGRKATKIFTGAAIKRELQKINWATHSLLCHNTAFDGLILSHHYGVVPSRYYDTLSMARGLHSNEIGGGLDDVSVFYGGEGKIKDTLELTHGVLNWDKALIASVGTYCARDVDECHRIFCEMVKSYPASEMELIHITIRMFCDPVLRVDIPRVQKEYERELAKRREILLTAVPDLGAYDYQDERGKWVSVLAKKDGRDELEGDERKIAVAKKVVGSNEKFVQLLLDAGVPDDAIPRKISPAWMKLDKDEREEQIDKKWSYAFAKDDLEFVDLPERVWEIRPDLDPNNEGDVMRAVAIQERLRGLVDVRLAVKSTTNITRAERFLEAGKDGMKLPVGYRYAAAHTFRWGGANSMNLQNLMRGGELRLSILAAGGHAIAVCDSGQIEARVNAWLWGQDDLVEAFHLGRDIYCEFATQVYGRTITKADKLERHIGKSAQLGLGFGMGVDKFQMTLAKGALGGPRVNFPRDQCAFIVSTYRTANYKIAQGWKQCSAMIEDMAAGASGEHKCIRWGGDGEGNGWVALPNGMYLKYPNLKRTRNDDKGWDEWSYQAKDVRKRIYGSLLTENLVQALARIIVAEQMLMIDRKYRCVMTTHDEVVAHPRLRDAEKCYQFMYQCMTTPLWWCPDIPLAAAGGWAENYSK